MYIYNTKLVSYNRSQEKICLCTIEKNEMIKYLDN